MSVDLRFSDIDPPAKEPKKTVYADIVDLPDPVKLGLTVRIFNYDEITLYMKVDGSGSGWAFTENNLGGLISGSNFYRNLDQFGTRARPASETVESVTVRLRAYTDAGYSNLKWTFERSVTVWFIKSDDGSWTEDERDNFDDGTIMGWAVANETGNTTGYPQIAVVTDYVLSPPYSVRIAQRRPSLGELRARLYKNFNTADRATVFGVVDIRQGMHPLATFYYSKYVWIQRNGTILIRLGRGYDTYSTNYVPMSKWMRIVFPLPRNESLVIRLIQDIRAGTTGYYCHLWLDDFRIISKD